MKITLAVEIWGLFYFLLLWRLPYCYKVNRIKLPDGCRTITVKARWSDMYASHIAMGKMFKADKINTDALWDEILEENQELWKDIQKLPKHMNRLYIRGWESPHGNSGRIMTFLQTGFWEESRERIMNINMS